MVDIKDYSEKLQKDFLIWKSNLTAYNIGRQIVYSVKEHGQPVDEGDLFDHWVRYIK